jgi:hypothetical protein
MRLSIASYRVILYQWLCILKRQGVPKSHVLAWAEFIDQVTVEHPSPSPIGPPLSILSGWEDQVHLGGRLLSFVSDVSATLQAWSEDDEIHRIVFILIGRGSEWGLWPGLLAGSVTARTSPF